MANQVRIKTVKIRPSALRFITTYAALLRDIQYCTCNTVNSSEPESDMEAVDSPPAPYRGSADAEGSSWKVTADFDVTPHVVSVVNEAAHPASTAEKPLTYKISSVRGCAYPVTCNEERWEYLNSNIRYRSSDILVVTYPKCGTTWIEQVVLLLLNRERASHLDTAGKNSYHPINNPVGKIWPEACINQDPVKGAEIGKEFETLMWAEFENAPAPRLLKSHAPVQLLLGTNSEGVEALPPGAKVVIVSRNPLDACVSCFYHAWNPYKSGWPFDFFFG
jgi:hypothetical protein